jgi:hypothetical protein
MAASSESGLMRTIINSNHQTSSRNNYKKAGEENLLLSL